jgi:exodeoxyribonuclease VII small subunit
MMAKKSNTADSTDRPNDDGPKFEDALAQLEQIVHDLEEGQIGLDEALQGYERGVKLLRRCYDLLQGAERRIEMLTGLDANGNPVTTPFENQATTSPEEKGQRRTASRTTPQGYVDAADPTGVDETGGGDVR